MIYNAAGILYTSKKKHYTSAPAIQDVQEISCIWSSRPGSGNWGPSCPGASSTNMMELKYGHGLEPSRTSMGYYYTAFNPCLFQSWLHKHHLILRHRQVIFTSHNLCGCNNLPTSYLRFLYDYRQTSNTSHTLVGNKIGVHSDAVGAPPVGAPPTTFSFST